MPAPGLPGERWLLYDGHGRSLRVLPCGSLMCLLCKKCATALRTYDFEKKGRDTLVGPNETEKIGAVVVSAIILSFNIIQRGGLTDKAVVCDAGGPWYESTCEHNIFSSFLSFFLHHFFCFFTKIA